MFRGLDAVERFELQVRRGDGCWDWRGATDKNNYAIFKGEVHGVSYSRGHRFSYALHKGPVPRGQLVCHTCDNPICTNPDHLYLGTNADNMADKIAKGRARVPRGEQAGHAKITETQALKILLDPRAYREIASDFGIAAATVGSIKNRDSWRHLNLPVVKGSHRGNARRGVSEKLTEQDVRDIRSSLDRGVELAERYGVSSQTICDIRKRRSWKQVA